MKKEVVIYFIIGVYLFATSSCSFQKRHYRRGYEVQWYNKAESYGSQETKFVDYYSETSNSALKYENSDLTSSIEDNHVFIPQKKNLSLKQSRYNTLDKKVRPILECDVIVRRNGEEIPAKVIELGIRQIKYKKCDDIDGQELVIDKSDVASIKYANGKREIIPMESKEDMAKRYNAGSSDTKSDLDLLSGLSLCLGILSFLPFFGVLCGLLAIILGSIAVGKYDNSNMNEPQLRRRGALGRLLGFLGILFSLLLLIFIVLSFFLII